MSTKTITKRVALATVVALGAGVLSLVTVSSANASETLTGNVVANATDGITAAVTSGSGASAGILAIGSGAGLLQTATLINTGTLTVKYTPTTNDAGILVTGGTISAYNNAGSVVTGGNFIGAGSNGAIYASVKPNAGVSSMTIQMYNSLAAAATSASAGTLEDQIVVSVATTSVAGTLSLTTSKLYYNNAGDYTPASSTSTQATVGSSDYATAQYFTINPLDAYSASITSGALIQATATNGALVSLTSGQNTTAPTISTAYVLSVSGTKQVAQVKAGALAATGGTTTVTVTVNGTVLGTIAFTFTGKVAKVTLSGAGNAYYNGGTNAANTIGMKFADAAGNAIYIPQAGSAAYPAALVKDTNGFKALGTGLSGTVAWPADSSTSGKIYVTCPSGTNVSDAAQIDYTNADGTTIVSNSLGFTCSGAPDTYTAKLDKSTYNPGDIATLTVSFADKKGSLAADYGSSASGITNGGANDAPAISGNLLTAVTAPTKADYTTNGVVVYKFIVGSPATGVSTTNALAVSFPYVNSNADGDATTVAYTVTNGGGTSLNDVLKGIVSLIASINKQIAALAKLVTKK